MITAVVTAIAITQREARRQQAEKEAEAAAAAKKSVLVVGGGISGLLVGLFCRQQGFAVTVADRKGAGEFLEGDWGEGVVWVPRSAGRVLRGVHERMGAEMRERACGVDTLRYRKHRSGREVCASKLRDTLLFAASDFHALLRDFTTAELKLETEIVAYRDGAEDLDGPLPQGRPYALTNKGEKIYADCIVVCDGDEGQGRAHVLASQGITELPEIDTQWNQSTGSILAEGLLGNDKAAALLQGGDAADMWVGPDAYVFTLVVGDGEEVIFLSHDLDAENEGELELSDLLAGWNPALSSPLTTPSPDTLITSKRLTIRQKPPSLVSRKSRKLLLFGKNCFTFPPHSPHLEWCYHVEAAATLAVCLRKAASVPLGLEVYSRLTALRWKEAMEMAQERFNTVTAAAAEAELEAADLLWEVEPGDGEKGAWWEYDAEAVAEKNFDAVIELLTQELLGKQRAMAEEQARAVEEERKRMEGEQKKAEEGLSEEPEEGESEEGVVEEKNIGENRNAGLGTKEEDEKKKEAEQVEAAPKTTHGNPPENEANAGEGMLLADEDEDEDGGIPVEEVVCSKPKDSERTGDSAARTRTEVEVRNGAKH
ncbi:hypothetical protein FN846DRAFT_916835 [Sphaerosporella brunnea]|uniref:FAD-binding domain-containing protein n=1 Tax=Sphaerosporella brunnea TaxID=1250544 RepID=A0A5J5F6B2_9PEZI|nr:hypothetical protein FN846DRAFT_916835 [Sphaerosporella brunnea]